MDGYNVLQDGKGVYIIESRLGLWADKSKY
jgi:hypothetical protein